MAETDASPSPTPAKRGAIKTPPATEVADDTMFKVTLNKPVSLYGFLFKPGTDITVNAATKTAMGDAVVDAKPV